MEHLVLYRKYRPQFFSEVTGQDHIVTVLKNALRLNRVAHAYLFSGTRGTGKTTMARLLAKAYNCENRDEGGEPCNKCSLCLEFKNGKALDLIELDAASSRGIDEIRELRESIRFSPSRAKRKVYIIDEVHMLTKEAFNALLKTLEEPPSHSMFILATTEPEKVPDTIISRAQHFEFRRIPQVKIRERIRGITKQEKYKIDEEALSLIAFIGDGSLRDAETALGQIMDAFPEGANAEDLENLFGLPKMKLVHNILGAALGANPVGIVESIEAISQKGIETKLLMRLLLNEAQTLLVTLINPKEIEKLRVELSEDHVAFFLKHNNVQRKILETLLIKLIEAYNTAYRGPFSMLPIEIALLEVAESVKS